jgi:predicted transposase YdaD
MILPEDLKQSFWQDLKAYEEARKMPYISTGEQIGYDRGHKEGRQEADQEALERQRSLILRLLTRKVGTVPESLSDRCQHLSLLGRQQS